MYDIHFHFQQIFSVRRFVFCLIFTGYAPHPIYLFREEKEIEKKEKKKFLATIPPHKIVLLWTCENKHFKDEQHRLGC